MDNAEWSAAWGLLVWRADSKGDKATAPQRAILAVNAELARLRTLPAELRAAAERHFFQPASESYAGDSCGACGDDWPCTVVRLLSWIEGRDAE